MTGAGGGREGGRERQYTLVLLHDFINHVTQIKTAAPPLRIVSLSFIPPPLPPAPRAV